MQALISKCSWGAAAWMGLAMAAATCSGQQILSEIVDQLHQPRVGNTLREGNSGFLGVLPDDALTAGQGVLVKEVVAGSAAQVGGLEAGDLITAVNGIPVRSTRDMVPLMETKVVGESVRLSIVRADQSAQVTVTLGDRSQPTASSLRVGTAATLAANPLPPRKLGVRSRKLDASLRTSMNIPPGVEGVIVAEIIADSPAQKAGIPVGAVITEVEGQPVTTPDQLAERIQIVPPKTTLTYWLRGEEQHRQVMFAGGGTVVARPVQAPAPFDAQPSDQVGASPAPVGDSRDQEVLQLRSRVKQLEQRIRDLEAKLPRTK